MVEAGHFAGSDDILEKAIRLEHDMLAVTDFNLASDDRIDERQFRQFAVEEIGHGFEHLRERRFLDEHGVEDAVLRVRLGILANATSGERSVADIHREEPIIHGLLSVHGEDHVLRLMLHDGSDEAKEIVDMV